MAGLAGHAEGDARGRAAPRPGRRSRWRSPAGPSAAQGGEQRDGTPGSGPAGPKASSPASRVRGQRRAAGWRAGHAAPDPAPGLGEQQVDHVGQPAAPLVRPALPGRRAAPRQRPYRPGRETCSQSPVASSCGRRSVDQAARPRRRPAPAAAERGRSSRSPSSPERAARHIAARSSGGRTAVRSGPGAQRGDLPARTSARNRPASRTTIVDVRAGVGDPQLQRRQVRRRPDVEVDHPGVGDRAGGDQVGDQRVVLGGAGDLARVAGGGPALPDQRAHAGVAGVLAHPVRRAGRQREQHRQRTA